MTTIKNRRFISSVSSLALLSLFFVGGISKVQNASAAFDAQFDQEMETQASIRRGVPVVTIPGNENPLSSGRRLVEKKSRLQGALRELQDTTQDLDATLTSAKQSMKKVQRDEQKISELTERVAELEQNLEDAEVQKTSLEERIVSLKKDLTKKKSDLRVASTANMGLENDLAGIREEVESLTTQLQQLQAQKEEKEQETETLREDLARQTAAKDKASKNAARYKAESDRLQTLIQEKEQELEQKNAKISDFQLDLDAAREKEEQLRQQIFTFVGDLQLEDAISFDQVLEGAELDEFFRQVKEGVHRQFLAANNAIMQLENEKEEVFRTLDAQRAQMAEQERAFTADSEQKTREIGRLKQSIQILEARILEAENAQFELKQDLSIKERELATSKEENRNLQLNVERLRKEQDRAQSKIKHLEDQVVILEQQKASAEEARDRVSSLLKAAQDLAAVDQAALKQEISELESRIEILQQEAQNEKEVAQAAHLEQISALEKKYAVSLKAVSDRVEEKTRNLEAVTQELDTLTATSLEQKKGYDAQLQQAQQAVLQARSEVENLGQEHSKQIDLLEQTQREELEVQKTLAREEKEEAVRAIQDEMRKAIATMDQERAQQVDKFLVAQAAVQRAKNEAETERQRLTKEHDDQVSNLKATQNQVVSQLEERLESLRQEVLFARDLVSQAETKAIRDAEAFQEKVRSLTESLEQESRKNAENQERLQSNYNHSLRQLDIGYKQIGESLASQLSAYKSRIAEKDEQLARNQAEIRRNKEGIQKIGEHLEQDILDIGEVVLRVEQLTEAGVGVISENEELTNQLAALKAKDQELSTQQEFLNQEIATLRQVETELVERNHKEEAQYKSEVAALKSQLEFSLASSRDLGVQLEESRAILKQVETAQEGLEYLLESDSSGSGSEEDGVPFVKTTRRVIALVKALQKTERQLNQQLVESEDSLETMKQEKLEQAIAANQVTSQYSEQERELKQAQSGIEEREAAILELNKKIESQQKVIHTSEKECLEMQQALLEKESKIEALEGKVREMLQQKIESEAKLHSLTKDLEKQESMVKEFRSQVTQLNQSFEAASIEVGQQEEDVRSLADILQSKQEEIENQKREYQEAEELSRQKIAELQGQLKASKTNIANVKFLADQQVAAAEEAADERIQEIEEFLAQFRDQLSTKGQELKKKERELADITQKFQAAQETLKERQEEIRKLKDQQVMLESERDDAQARVDVLLEELAEMRSQNASLESLLKTAEAQRQKLKAESQASEEGPRSLSVLKELAEAKSTLQEVKMQKESLDDLMLTLTEETDHRPVGRGNAALKSELSTPVKSNNDTFKTPVKVASSTPLMVPRSPGAAVISNPLTPTSKAVVGALSGFKGGINASNQVEFFKALRAAGIPVDSSLLGGASLTPRQNAQVKSSLGTSTPRKALAVLFPKAE